MKKTTVKQGIISPFICTIVSALLTACGGGGGGSDSPPPPANATGTTSNVAPVANAGSPQTADEGQVVTLDGGGSLDEDGDSLTYTWEQLSGPAASLSFPRAVDPQFHAPSVTDDAVLTFRLVVNDGKVGSPPATVDITVLNVNQAPLAKAGSDQTVQENTRVELDGSGSSDPEDDALTYLWTQVGGSTVSLSDVTTLRPSFDAPDLESTENLAFRLDVDDGAINRWDFVTIIVEADNDAPVADAGMDQTVSSGAQVVLDATGSTDPEGSALSYSWSAPSYIALSDSTSATPSFLAGTRTDTSLPESHIFSVEITDAGGKTHQDSVNVGIKTSFLTKSYSISGAADDDLLGSTLVPLDDLNNDGVADFAAGALRYDGVAGVDSGAVYIFSGADGAILAELEGEGIQDYFGRSLSRIRDLNGDGFDELVIGANNGGVNSRGRVYVYSGNLAHHQSDSATDPLLFIAEDDSLYVVNFGWSTTAISDVNGDGYDEIAVGAPMTSHRDSDDLYAPLIQSGRVYVFSGNYRRYGSGPAADNILFIIEGENGGDEFGTALASTRSLSGNFWQDLVVGAPDYDGAGGAGSGKVYVYAAHPAMYEDDMFTDPRVYELEGESAGDSFGYSIDLLPDANDDGYPELVIGAPSFVPGDMVNAEGTVYVHSGNAWGENEVLFKFQGTTAGDQFGGDVAVLEDANGDGFADIGVLAFRHYTNDWDIVGSFGVFSGNPADNVAGPTRAYFWMGEQVGTTIGSVSAFADVDGDGMNEMLLGAPVFDPSPSSDNGRIYLLSSP